MTKCGMGKTWDDRIGNLPEITITGEKIKTGEGHSSKGNQLKWEQDGWWYKADAFGYESLAEVVVSRLLARSNISDFVMYEPVVIRYQDRIYRGCRREICAKPFSRDFDEQLDAAEERYGSYLKFDFPANRICDVLKELRGNCNVQEERRGVRGEAAENTGQMGYAREELFRVEEVLRYQAGKYGYLFYM